MRARATFDTGLKRSVRHGAVLVAILALAGCATPESPPREPVPLPLSAAAGRALVTQLLPAEVSDRTGWAADIHASIAALELPETVDNICAAIAVVEQESGFRADPPVPGLARIARKEIDARRERAGVPKLVLDAALALPSSNGRSYRERLDGVTTEGQLSDIYEDFIGRVPLGKTFFADRNPVRTAGPMQVSVAFAEVQIQAKPYPYPIVDGVRRELFTRRGGVYFGIAHLLDYRASYDRQLYRFADFNAGRYASRNAAFQRALTDVSGIPLAQDGDLLRYADGRPLPEAGNTELAARVVAKRLGLSDADIRRELELGNRAEFEGARLYTRVFALADELGRRRSPRAVVPTIVLHGPKLSHALTTEGFARRVDARYRQCLGRREGSGNAAAAPP